MARSWASMSTRRGGGCVEASSISSSPATTSESSTSSPRSTRTCSCTSRCGSPTPAPAPQLAKRLTSEACTRSSRPRPGPVAGVDHRAQWHRDLRTRSRRADPPRRGRTDQPDQRIRTDARRGRSRSAHDGGRAQSASASVCCAWRRCSVHTCPARSVECLRQPAVPFSLLANSPFTVVLDSDAARAFVVAAAQRVRSAQRRRPGSDLDDAGDPSWPSPADPAGRARVAASPGSSATCSVPRCRST